MIRYRLSLGVFFACLVLAELGLGLARGPYWRDPLHRDPASVPLLNDRLAALRAPAAPKRLLILGDSVFYGSALREHKVADWEQKTVAAALRRALPGWEVVDFSGDGLNLPDLEALYKAGLALKPDRVLLELNYRMFAAGANFAKPWLSGSGADSAPLDARLKDALLRGLRRVSLLFRYSEQWRPLIFAPTAEGLADAAVGPLFPPAEEGDAEMLLDLKLRPYYLAPAMDAAHPALQALRQFGPAMVFMTPQNLERVSDYLDKDAYKKNIALAAAALKISGNTMLDWSGRKPEGAFLDHCHLDEAGNAGMANWIVAELNRGH